MRKTRGHYFLWKELVKRDFQARYAGSLFGFLWSFLLPVWQLVLFTFVFSTVLKVSLVGERSANFGVFLFCGLMPWLAIQEGIQRSTTAITDNAELVKKVSFPAEILILAVVSGALVQEAIAAAIFFVVLAGMGELGWQGLPLLALAVPLQVGLTLGLGFFLSVLHTFVRDIGQLLGMVLMGWFYFTPIVYPLGQVPEPYRGWLALNPLSVLVELYRQALLGGAVRWVDGTGSLAIFAAVLLAAGLWLFQRLKGGLVDEV